MTSCKRGVYAVTNILSFMAAVARVGGFCIAPPPLAGLDPRLTTVSASFSRQGQVPRGSAIWIPKADVACSHANIGAPQLRGKRWKEYRASHPLSATVGPAPTVQTVAGGNSTESSSSSQGGGYSAGAMYVEATPAVPLTVTSPMEARGGIHDKPKQSWAKTLWQFSRPHTMIGTALAIPSLTLFASPPGAALGGRFVLAMLWAIIPSLLINIYITGLNQITDIEIDRVNKPQLPIVAGHLSPRVAKLTVSFCLVAGTVLGLLPTALGSPGLAMTVVLSVLIGTSYSLPPIRLKRFPQMAAMCVLVVRGSLINAGFYAHAQTAVYGVMARRSVWETLAACLGDMKCSLAITYFTVFAAVIALLKDVPDVSGDRKFNIPSFSVVFGERRLFFFSQRLLTALLWSYGAALALGTKAAVEASMPMVAACRGLVALSALMSGRMVRRRAVDVDPNTPSQVYKFYMFAWKIFYASYLLLPFAR